jgi:hypothetical protein
MNSAYSLRIEARLVSAYDAAQSPIQVGDDQGPYLKSSLGSRRMPPSHPELSRRLPRRWSFPDSSVGQFGT